MTFHGMDPERLRNLAAALGAQGSALDEIADHVDGLVRQALHAWPGDDAAAFHQWWVNHYRPRLVSAASGVHQASQGLRHQVEAQLEASGESARSMVGGRTGGVVDETSPDLLGVAAGLGSGALGLMSRLTADRFVTGRYPDWWKGLTGGPDFLRFKGSPVLQGLNHLGPFVRGAGTVGTVIGVGGSYLQAYQLAEGGDWLGATQYFADGTADALGEVPVYGTLASVALHAWTEVSRQAMEIDWGYMDETWAYAAANPGEVVASLGSATLEVGVMALGWVL